MSYKNTYKLKVIQLPTIEVKTSKCSKCDNISDSKFCPECGNKMEPFIESKTISEKEIINDLLSSSQGFEYVYENGTGGWDSDSDMIEFSKKYPNAVFQLDTLWEHGLSETPDRDYFMNGKRQRSKLKMMWTPFNINELK